MKNHKYIKSVSHQLSLNAVVWRQHLGSRQSVNGGRRWIIFVFFHRKVSPQPCRLLQARAAHLWDTLDQLREKAQLFYVIALIQFIINWSVYVYFLQVHTVQEKMLKHALAVRKNDGNIECKQCQKVNYKFYTSVQN